jgi:hypothetical protein
MKIALLLFGQPRNIENSLVYESYKKWVISKYDTDVFAHVWYEPNQVFKPSDWSKLKDIECNPSTLNILQNSYNPVRMEDEIPKVFKLNEKYRTSAKFTKFHYFNDHNISNIISQLYSIDRVCEIYKKYCNETGNNYDFIILGRYDLIIESFPNIIDLDKQYFYTMNHHPRFPDLFFIFNPQFLDTQNTYNNLDKLCEKLISSDKDFWEFSVECLKFNNFIRFKDRNLIRGVFIKERRNN